MENEENVRHCYTDASYHPQMKFGVYGFILPNGEIRTDIVKGIGIARTEEMAIERCIEEHRRIDTESKLIIHTDHTLSNKRSRSLEWREKFPNVELVHIFGHKKKFEMDDHDVEFSKVDKETRRVMRSEAKRSIIS